jgi:Holliday junction resolvasome RuvABC endonuclease subunit
MKSLGIDISTKATGIVLLEASDIKTPKLLLEKVIKPSVPDLEGWNKYRDIAFQVMSIIQAQEPQRIVIEGYSLNTKNVSSIVPLVELGGLIRFCMNLDGHIWLDPRAGELKKFVTGSGNAQKSTMMMHVLDRWGHKSIDDNTADAYGCACIGLAHSGKLVGATKEQRTVVGALKLRAF